MDSLQETAREQLVNLAAQGENAVGVAQSQLMKAHNIIEQFQLFVKVTDSIKYCIRYYSSIVCWEKYLLDYLEIIILILLANRLASPYTVQMEVIDFFGATFMLSPDNVMQWVLIVALIWCLNS